MAYRSLGGFSFNDRIIAGGQLVEDDDPILDTHAEIFVKVAEPAAPAGETASTDVPRKTPAKKAGPKPSANPDPEG